MSVDVDRTAVAIGVTSFDEFFRAEQPKMVALAYVLTGDREVARDVAQDAMLQAYQRWSSVKELDRPGAWVRRVTINSATSWHRRARRARVVRSRLVGNHAEPPLELDEVFWAHVRRLPASQRTAVALYYVEDLSIADVAEAMGTARGTVKATLSKARANLSARLANTSTEMGLER